MSTFNPNGLFYGSYNPASLEAQSFVASMIRMYPAGTQPLFAASQYFKPLKDRVVGPTFNYYVKEFLFPKLKINHAAYDDAATTLVVDSTLGCVPGQTFQVPATREIIRIASITNATTVVVTRAFGRVAAGAIVDDAVLFCTGNAHTEASTRPVALTTNSTVVPNYTSIFRSAWGISNTAAATETIMQSGYNNLAETRAEAAAMHSLTWEQTALFSQPVVPSTDAATGKPIHATQGLLDAIYQYASTNVHTAAATTTFAQLETMLETSLAKGNSVSQSTQRTVLCDRQAFKVVSDIGRLHTAAALVVEYGTTVFGSRYSQMRTTFGDFNFVESTMLNGNGQPGGLAIVCDFSTMGVGYLGNRDAIPEQMDGAKDANDSGLDAKQGGMLTEMVFCTMVPSSNAVINGLTAAA